MCKCRLPLPCDSYIRSLREQQRLLLFRVVHAINREQELAAPMVISYLMGWGDVKRSHHYVPVYWSSFARAIQHAFPSLRGQENTHPAAKQSDPEESEVGSSLFYHQFYGLTLLILEYVTRDFRY